MKKMHNQSNTWFDGEKFTPFENMSRTHLRNAKIYAQRQELYFFNRHNIFDELLDFIQIVKDRNEEFDPFVLKNYYEWDIHYPNKEKIKFEKFTTLENARKFTLKKRSLYWKRYNWFSTQARNIDNYANKEGFKVADYPSEYHRNSRALQQVTDKL